MSKKIKYRAWDKVKKEFIDFNKIGFLEDGSMWYLQGLDEYENEIDPPYFEDDDTWVLLQFTGLKDKNGVGIYEGDVIKNIDNKTNVVNFKNGGFGIDKIYTIDYRTGKRHTSHEPLINWVIDGCEVIGNIYKNPELLEASK